MKRNGRSKDFSFSIVSSTDHPFAIPDAFREYHRDTKESLLVCTPYVSKEYFDMVRILPSGATVKLLTRVPNEKDRYMFGKTCRAIESLIRIADSLGLNLSIMCKPNLHAKFIVIDDRIVLSGSVNPTSSGMYDNDEILYVFQNHADVKRHIDIFDKLWKCPRNTAWETVQLYFGLKGYGDRNSIYEKIAEAILGFFHLNGNRETKIRVLVEKIAGKGFNEKDVIEVIKNLRRNSPVILYEPKRDMLKLVDYQTNIHDF